jgi:hypothetical protein
METSTAIESLSRQISEAKSSGEWQVWFFSLLFVSIGLTIAYGFGKADIAIYLSMAALAFFAFLASFRDVRTLDHEVSLASRQMKQLIDLDDIEEFLDQTRGPKDSSFFRAHIAALYQIYTVSSEISQDTLIEILHSRLMAKNRKVELLASILITVGLIGTILGLMFMMDELIVSMAAVNEEGGLIQALTAKGGPLAGLGIAFITTLIGALCGGVILRILSSIVEEGITKYVTLLAEITEVNVLPILRQNSQQ